jgi:hypothetical protein
MEIAPAEGVVRAEGSRPSGVPTAVAVASIKSAALLLLTGLEYPAPSSSEVAGWYSSGRVGGACGKRGSLMLLL